MNDATTAGVYSHSGTPTMVVFCVAESMRKVCGKYTESIRKVGLEHTKKRLSKRIPDDALEVLQL